MHMLGHLKSGHVIVNAAAMLGPRQVGFIDGWHTRLRWDVVSFDEVDMHLLAQPDRRTVERQVGGCWLVGQFLHTTYVWDAVGLAA